MDISMRLKWFSAALCLALTLAACSDSVESPGQTATRTDTHVIRDLDYVKGKYFFFDHPLVFVGPDDAFSLDVYREVLPQDIAANPEINRQKGVALLDRDAFGTDIDNFMTAMADTMAANASLDADEAIVAVSTDTTNVIPIPVRNSNFRLLESNVDYQFITDPNDDVIGIELVQPMNVGNGTRSLAVRYTNVEQSKPPGISRPFGVGGSFEDWGIPFNPDIGQQNRVVLEIVFAETSSWPGTDFGFTWSYMMRHVYDLGFNDIDPVAFSLDIEDIFDLRLDRSRPKGSDEPYIRIFGLDQTDDAGTGPPDGRIDLTTGIVDLEKGLLYMPFWRTLLDAPNPAYVDHVESWGLVAHVGVWPDTTWVSQWTDGQFQFDGAYEEQWQNARRIYAEHLNTQGQQLLNQYNIIARRTRVVTEW